MFFVGIMGWVIAGLIVGFAASRMVDLRGDDPRLGMALAGVAAFVGGWMYSWISGSPVVWFNVWTLLWACLAASGAVAIWHASRRSRAYARPSTRRSY